VREKYGKSNTNSTTATNDASIGSVAWNGLESLTGHSLMGIYADVNLDDGVTSNRALLKTFLFSILSTATINGVEAELFGHNSDGAPFGDIHAALIVGGTIGDENDLNWFATGVSDSLVVIGSRTVCGVGI